MRKKGCSSRIREVVENIFRTRNLEVKEASSSVPLRALTIMEQYHLKPRDAFHVAVMEECGARTVVSDDKDFDRVKGIKRISLS